MTQGKLQSVVASYRAQVLANEAQAAAHLEQAYQQTLHVVNGNLDVLYRAMQAKIQAGQEIPVEWLYENNRLHILQKHIAQSFDHFGALSQMTVGQLQHQAVALGQESAQAMLQSTVPTGVKYAFGVPSQKAITDLVGVTQDGSPLATLFNGFGAEAAKNATQALITGVSLGYGPRDIADSVQQALGVSRNRALTIARTECLRCYRSAALLTYQQNSDVVDKWIWSCALDSHCCVACIAMQGTEHDLDEDLNGHPNCFPAGTIVSGPSVVASSKRWYSGSLVEIKTTFGHFLSVTPNHPILTPDGWIAAGDLAEGDYVVSRVDSERPFIGINPDEYQVPSLIEEVVETLTSPLSMATISVPTTSKDFHNDGTDGDVCIIRADIHLLNRSQSEVSQPLSNDTLNRRDMRLFRLSCLRTFAQLFKGTFRASHSFMSGMRPIEAFFLRHSTGHEDVCLTCGTPLNTSNFQTFRNGVTRNTVGFSKSLFRLTREVTTNNVFGRQKRMLHLRLRNALIAFLPPFRRFSVNSDLSTFSKGTNNNVSLLKPLFKYRRTYMIFLSKIVQSFTRLISAHSRFKPLRTWLRGAISLRAKSHTLSNEDGFDGTGISMEHAREVIDSLAGSVQSDQIIRIRYCAFSGHVYNLQTTKGWYSANNIITHNCRCARIPKTKSWNDILSSVGIDSSDIPDTTIQVQSGSDWFDNQDEDTQKSILGPSAYQLYSNGDVDDISDFVGIHRDKDWGDSVYVKSVKQLTSN